MPITIYAIAVCNAGYAIISIIVFMLRKVKTPKFHAPKIISEKKYDYYDINIFCDYSIYKSFIKI